MIKPFLFTIDFKSLYTNIPVEDAINFIKQLVWEYQNVIRNTEFLVEILDVNLKNSLMMFDGEYFQQIFGVIMGPCKYLHGETGKILKDKCKNK